MSKLAAALAWAARGFDVFPLRENTREPAFEGNWLDQATSDPAQIRAMWTDPVLGTERDYNIGCKTNDYVVMDVDVKNGKDGYNQYLQMGGVFDTLVVRTTSGGYHCYFYGPDARGSIGLANGVDVRSYNNYVVAPGSVIDGKAYYVETDKPITYIPDAIERRLEKPYVRPPTAENVVTDTPAMIEAGKSYLESAPPAVEGMRGDETTFITAARLVREMALSPVTAFRLMREHWNPRCVPPWDEGDLYKKVENAWQYGTAQEGRITPEVLYGHIEEPAAPPTVFEQLALSDDMWGNAIEPRFVTKRPVLIDRILMRRAVTVLLSPGSGGKSSLSLAIAAHLALGKAFAGLNVTTPCRTLVYNGEDDLEEQSRRLYAVCAEYGLSFEAVRPHVLMLSSRDIKLKLVRKDGGKAFRDDTIVQQLTDFAIASKIGMMVLDPLVRIHDCNENDNGEMDLVMDTITDIAHKANTSMLLLHHVSKAGTGETRIGNADIARGASAVINAARIALTLLNANASDTDEYGIPSAERNRWVRLDDAKMNLSLAGQSATWFERTSVKLYNGDMVGVLAHRNKGKDETYMKTITARAVADELMRRNTSTMSVQEAVVPVRNAETIHQKKRPHEVRQMIIDHLFGGVALEDGRKITAVLLEEGRVELRMT